MATMQYIFPLFFIPPPPAPAQEPPPPTALSAPQPPNGPMSSGFGEGIPLYDVSGEVYMVVDLLDTPELVELSSDDKPMEEYQEENLDEDPELGEHQANQASTKQSRARQIPINSGEDPGDEFDPDYDPF